MSKYRRTTWREKLADDKGLPQVISITGKMTRRWGEGTCAIPAPREVDGLIRRVPKGKLTTINELRVCIARTHGATIGCPTTTGIFAWIAAHAAAEDEAEGKKRITPWWRVLKEGGKLNPKYPGGVEEQSRRLRAEGHQLLPGKGQQPPKVLDYERRLARLQPPTTAQ
jgi:alkylated DNA nucleotide flippase Atl1